MFQKAKVSEGANWHFWGVVFGQGFGTPKVSNGTCFNNFKIVSTLNNTLSDTLRMMI